MSDRIILGPDGRKYITNEPLLHEDKQAAELRRLHSELERKSDAIQRLWKERDELRTLNAELAEALQRYHRIVCANAIDLDCDAAIDKAHAALAKVEASK